MHLTSLGKPTTLSTMSPFLRTTKQRTVHRTVVDAVTKNEGDLFIIDAPIGTGKIFLEKVIVAKWRSAGKIVLIISSLMYELPLDEQGQPGAVKNTHTSQNRTC